MFECVCVYVPSSGLSIIPTNVNVPDMQMLRRIVGVLCYEEPFAGELKLNYTVGIPGILQICVYISSHSNCNLLLLLFLVLYLRSYFPSLSESERA